LAWFLIIAIAIERFEYRTRYRSQGEEGMNIWEQIHMPEWIPGRLRNSCLWFCWIRRCFKCTVMV